jgi:hypothetical protein
MKSTTPDLVCERNLHQALNVKRTFKKSDPWKSIRGVQLANCGIAEAEIELAVARAVRAVRKDRRS